MEISTLLTYCITCLAMAFLPGPDIYFVLETSLRRGFRAGLCIALGLCTGCMFHTFLCAAGVSLLIASSPILMNAIRLFGACYLGYLAYLNWRSKPQSGASATRGGDGGASDGLYLRGVLMNVSNPKVIVFFLSFFPQFLTENGWAVWLQICVLGAIFAASALAVFSAVSFFAARAAKTLDSPKFAAVMRIVGICVFGGLSLALFAEILAA